MSIYSSLCCPENRDHGEVSIATSISWGKIRLSCNECGWRIEYDINEKEEIMFRRLVDFIDVVRRKNG